MMKMGSLWVKTERPAAPPVLKGVGDPFRIRLTGLAGADNPAPQTVIPTRAGGSDKITDGRFE
jgi:hypothetical protein